VAGVALDLGVRGSQRKLRCLAVIKADRRPFALVMTAVALGAVATAMDVLNAVTIHACDADIRVALARMAGRAGDGAMRIPQRELGPVVIERFDGAPGRLGMAILARFPEPSLVRIVRLVTAEAAIGRFAVFCRLDVATAAGHRRVGVPKREIRARVREGLGVEQDDVGVSSLVIRVAMGAFELRCIRIAAVKPFARLKIGARFLVAGKAKLGLGSM